MNGPDTIDTLPLRSFDLDAHGVVSGRSPSSEQARAGMNMISTRRRPPRLKHCFPSNGYRRNLGMCCGDGAISGC